jgi:hypothetical protein
MYRSLVFSAVIAALLASRADAIEMFTNFNNGTNVGFPPMEVPVGIYRGFGRGGWNPHAEGMYFRSNPPVPAMMPTGQAPRPIIYTSGPAGRDFSTAERTSDVQYTADRRRGGRRQMTPGNTMPQTGSYSPSIPSESTQPNAGGPTPAKAPEEDVTSTPSIPSKKAQRSVTVLRAQPGKLPKDSTSTSSNERNDSAPQSPSGLFPSSTN